MFGGGGKNIDLSKELAPLVAWLEPLLEQGFLAKDDHLCYCPDEQLHLVPLQYLPFKGGYLVEQFSISRKHSALALQSILEQPAIRPSEKITIEVASQQEVQNPVYSAKVQAFRLIGDYLSSGTGTTRLQNEQATIAQLKQLDLSNKLVHFATHGVFPNRQKVDDIKEVNPYLTSGLLLTANGQLPELQLDSYTDNAHLLSPKKWLGLCMK